MLHFEAFCSLSPYAGNQPIVTGLAIVGKFFVATTFVGIYVFTAELYPTLIRWGCPHCDQGHKARGNGGLGGGGRHGGLVSLYIFYNPSIKPTLLVNSKTEPPYKTDSWGPVFIKSHIPKLKSFLIEPIMLRIFKQPTFEDKPGRTIIAKS